MRKFWLVLTLIPTMAWGQAQPIGKVLVTTGQATINGKEMVSGAALFLGDQIKTGAGSAVGIAFTDGTSFNISQNATMTIEKYVYDPKGHNNSTFFTLSRGVFTFIAGQSAKTGTMKVDTPAATMGIRGTAPRVEILEDGSVKFSTLIEENKK